MDWTKQVILVTGGTGSFGKKFIEIMLRDYHPAKLIVFSRDELKQHEMRVGGFAHPSLRYFISELKFNIFSLTSVLFFWFFGFIMPRFAPRHAKAPVLKNSLLFTFDIAKSPLAFAAIILHFCLFLA